MQHNITAKHCALTAKEIEGKRINSLIMGVLAEKESPNLYDSKILDWGCGRGITVAKLCQLGYDAKGVEVSENTINQSKAVFKDLGLSWEERLSLIGIDNKTAFENESIDLIITEEVVEHISDIEGFASECSRILKTDGLIYAVFPSKYNPFEPHLKMPFVHWFGKGLLAKFLISLFVFLKIKPNWIDEDKECEVYYNYLKDKLHYRSLEELSEIFSKYSLSLKVVTERNKTFNQIRNKSILRFIPRKVMAFLVSRFYVSHVLIKKDV